MRWPCHSARNCSSASTPSIGAGGSGGKAPDEAGTVAVDADMSQRWHGRQRLPVAGQGASRHHGIGARLKYRASPRASQHHLHHVRIEEVGKRRRSGAPRCSCRIGPRCRAPRTASIRAGSISGSSPCTLTTSASSASAELGAGFGQPVAAAGVVGAGQQCLDAVRAAGLENALVVGGDQHARARRLHRTLGHPHHHRYAGDISQGFVGQAGGSQACRNKDGEVQAQRSSSSSDNTRASSSSITGMPSRTG